MNENESKIYKGFVLSESLNCPVVLNDYDTIYVKVEEHHDSSYPDFWHLFKLKVNQDTITEAVESICNQLKTGWYAHFWNERVLFICLPKKIFKIERDSMNYKNEIDRVKDFAENVGINRCYLDFCIED